MSNVFEVIAAIMRWKGYNLGQVARQAGVTYTTLASIMSRRSQTISKRMLINIASVFEVEWYELLNCKNEDEPVLLITGRYSDEPRVATDLSVMDLKQTLQKVIGDDYMNYLNIESPVPSTSQPKAKTQRRVCDNDLRLQFKQSIDFVLNKLNDEGLMEVMRRVLDIAQDPKFCISTTTDKKKEDDECQGEEQ